jgi:hypothetical protein
MNRVTNDDALFGSRLQPFDLAARTSVAHARRTMGVHRSTITTRSVKSTATGRRSCVPPTASAGDAQPVAADGRGADPGLLNRPPGYGARRAATLTGASSPGRP